jgi:predicted Zn-dependent protease
MTRERFDPHGMSDVMRMLQSTQPAGGGGVPDWLSSHPDPGDRVQANEQRIAAANTNYGGYTVNGDAFIQRLDGLVFGDDPRNGYFIGTRFLQPTLTFEFTFPSGWATHNGVQSVQALSGGKDAALQLSFAQASSPAEATSKLASMEGLTIQRQYSESVNGINGSFTDFLLQTQSGVLQGTILYLAHGSAVYEIVGYGTQANWASNTGPVRSALRSFARLTNRTYLDVAPNRIDIVKLPRAMTFADFARQYSSTVPLDQVALANQVSQSASLPAGRLMQRISGGRMPTH